MDRARHSVAHPRDGAEGIGPRTQVRNRAEELEGMLLLLQRIALGIGQPVQGDGLRLHLGGLPFGRRLLEHSHYADAGSGRELLHLALVIGQRGLGEDLDIAERRSVVEFEETESGLRVAARPHPTLQEHFAADVFGPPRLGHAHSLHFRTPGNDSQDGKLSHPAHATGRRAGPTRGPIRR